MTTRRRRPVQLAEGSSALLGRIDWRSLGDDPVGEIRSFVGATTAREFQERLDAEIRTEVNAILEACRDFDAFDVIELLRLRELPIVPVLGLRDDYDGSGAAIDMVALILLSRTSRMPTDRSPAETRPHMVIAELHQRATKLVRLATYMRTAQAVVLGRDPLSRLAAEYQTHHVSVRALQYESVQAEHDHALLDRPEIETLLRARLGFSYGEFVSTRDAIQRRYSRILTDLRDTTGDLMMRAEAEGRELTDQESATFRASMISMMFLPAERASFNAVDISDEASLDLSRVEAVLTAFSIDFGGVGDASAAVRSFLRGPNPLAKTCLLRDAGGQHVMAGAQIGADSFRSIAEAALKSDSKAWRRYDRTRAAVSETLTVAAMERLLQTPATHTNLKYFGPKERVDLVALGADCPAPGAVGDPTEADGLFVIDDVAICVEVKGRTVADAARRGDLARLRTEVDNILGAGAGQARRLESLIRTNGGIWLDDGTWLDLSTVKEARSVVVALDSLGPLAVALGDLERSTLLGVGTLPWITSLHDLEIISRVIDRPAEFLLYLRRRADSGVAIHYRGSDELDLFMLFLDGGLYVEPDPDQVRQQHTQQRHQLQLGTAASMRQTLGPRSSAPTPTRSTHGCTGSKGQVPTRPRSQPSIRTSRRDRSSTSSPMAANLDGSDSVPTSSASRAARRRSSGRTSVGS